MLTKHCLYCTALFGCCFARNQMPTNYVSNDGLLHPHCHCFTEEISNWIVNNTYEAVCPITKFTDYIFSEKYISNGKKKLFEILGYTIADSYKLKWEYEKQAREKYINGDYTLQNLDIHGQNINIIIELTNKNGKAIQFISGWKVYPNGLINCNTPLGDK